MSLEQLIQEGWRVHDSESESLADRLEAGLALIESEADAAQWMNLASHTVGDHLGDRARARRLCERAVARLENGASGPAALYLAVARTLDGDPDGADEAAAPLGDDPSTGVRIGMLVAQGQMHAHDWDASLKRYQAELDMVNSLPEGNAAERSVAIVSNNMASELLELPARTEAQEQVMQRAADAAFTYWKRVGTWVNEERGEYLRSLVATACGHPDAGLAAAQRGLDLIAANGTEEVDQAFLYLAAARAHRDLGQAQEHAERLAQARRMADQFDDAGLTAWFDGEYAKAEATPR